MDLLFFCADPVLKSFPQTQWHCRKTWKTKNPFLWKETPLFCHLSSSAFSWPEALKIIYLIKPLGEALSWCTFAFEASLLVVYREPNEQMTPKGKFCLFPQRSAQKRDQHLLGHKTWALRDTIVTTSLLPYAPTIWGDPGGWVWHSASLHCGFLTWPTYLLESSFHSWKRIFAITWALITCITKRDVKGFGVVHWALSCLGTCPEKKVECVS